MKSKFSLVYLGTQNVSVLVNFYVVWKHSYFKHMLKISFNQTDIIF